jgi:hypothetical protein
MLVQLRLIILPQPLPPGGKPSMSLPVADRGAKGDKFL